MEVAAGLVCCSAADVVARAAEAGVPCTAPAACDGASRGSSKHNCSSSRRLRLSHLLLGLGRNPPCPIWMAALTSSSLLLPVCFHAKALSSLNEIPVI